MPVRFRGALLSCLQSAVIVRSLHSYRNLNQVKMNMLKKADFPTKICLSCHRPFAWRKKWKLVWDEVKYCSDACRKHRNKNAVHQKSAPETQ